MAKGKNLLLTVFSLSFLLALLGAVLFFVDFEKALGSDLVSFLTGAYIIRDGHGQKLFDLDTQYVYQQKVIAPASESSVLPFENLPVFAFMLIPLTYLPLLTAYKIYVFIVILAYVTSSLLSVRIFTGLKKGFWWLLLPFVFYPSLGSIFSGQTTPILILVLLLSLLAIKEKRNFLAGVAISFLFLKIQYIVIIPFVFLLAKDKVKFVKGSVLSSAILLATSFAINGWDFIMRYYKFIFSVQRPEFGIRVDDMFTLHSTLSRTLFLSKMNYWQLFWVNTVLYVLIIIGFYALSKRVGLKKGYCLAILLGMTFSVHGVNYDYALTLLPLYFLLERVKTKKIKTHETWALFMLLLTPVLFVLQISFYASIFLLAAALLLVKDDLFFNKGQ